MSIRIEKLHDRLFVEQYPLCVEKIRLITESYKQNESDPVILRRAKALANTLDNISIFIEDDELIVGNAASKPMGLEMAFWYGLWSPNELNGLKKESFTISEDDEKEILKLNEYWKGKNVASRCEQFFDEERLWPFMESGIYCPPWKKTEGWGGGNAESGMGLGPSPGMLVIDYQRVLERGLNSVIDEAENELRNTMVLNRESIQKIDFLKAVIITHKAVIRFANRFAELAENLSVKELNPSRKEELHKIAVICKKVPANPANTFYEAMQSFWFIFLILNPSVVVGAGRFDQYMHPFYKKDIDGGITSNEEVLELLQCLRIKDMQLFSSSGQKIREKKAGIAKWHNWTIGGQTITGEDATNELTYLILDAVKLCKTPHHTVTLRVHDKTPDSLLIKALEVVKTGIGIPAFIGDKSYIQYLLDEGLPLETARNYVITGCIDASIPGQSRVKNSGMFIVPLVLEIFMRNGIEPRTGKQLGPKTGDIESFESFDTMMKAFKIQLAHFMELYAEFNRIHCYIWCESFPDPFTSSLMTNGIKEGKSIFDRVMPFENGSVMNPVGMINVADSLAAIKKLVFQEKKVSMTELKQALIANWQGDRYSELRKLFIAAPKFGNDNDAVDSIAQELYSFWAETAIEFDSIFGGKHKPVAFSVSAHWPGGALTGATPDGRYAGEYLADGSMSPGQGRDLSGPTAVIKSAMKINQNQYQATLLNMKLHPSIIKTEEDLKKLSYLIRTYFESGGKHIQFNIVGRETLVNAQKQPANHRDLIVRVAGYSAYFIQLGQIVQNEIITRTEHQSPLSFN